MLKIVLKRKSLYSKTILLSTINYSSLKLNEDPVAISTPKTLEKSFSEIPGPKLYPFIGNLLELKTFGLFILLNKNFISLTQFCFSN